MRAQVEEVGFSFLFIASPGWVSSKVIINVAVAVMEKTKAVVLFHFVV